MKISLSKTSEVPLRQQLTEQIVFLITTGQLRPGEELPSVRALARQTKVHYNTVSEAYQDLVRREWLSRQRGSRLVVGSLPGSKEKPSTNLDDVINSTIQRAKELGYSLQQLTERVRERLAAHPPDHILVVEEEPALCQIVREELRNAINLPIETCTPTEFAKNPSLAIGAQVIAPSHTIQHLVSLFPQSRPFLPITYSSANEHIDLIHRLKSASVVGLVSVSESLLKTARGLFAPVIGTRHTMQEFLMRKQSRIELGGVDVVFCDTVAKSLMKHRKSIHYRLLAEECIKDLASVVDPEQIKPGVNRRQR
jgi:DNA-binding transcriptional regulator YhcF (GntR family)